MSRYLENSKKYKGFHYSVLEPQMLEYLHSKTLEMLRVLIPIFDRNDIRYMICGGTLLGAVTTGKFIPWDDDVDICVLDEDYEITIDLLIRELPAWMELQCEATEARYFHGWAKVRDRHSHVYPDISAYKENGVWIDLYKLTVAKKSEVPYLITKEHFDYLNRRCKVGDITEEEKDRRIRQNNLIERLHEQKISMELEDSSERTYIIWSASKIQVDVHWVFPRMKYQFEGMELYSFNDAKQYLERHYGRDYLKLPPDEMRRVGINRIELI